MTLCADIVDPETGEVLSSYSIDSASDVTAVDLPSLQENFLRLPTEVAHWAEKLAVASKEYTLAKARAEMQEARLIERTRIELQKTNPKVSQSAAERRAKGLARWLEIKAEVAEAEGAKVYARGIMDALQSKQSALISVGASMRAELGALNPLIKERT